MKSYFTIKDLAAKLDLHHTTVSRALRDHPDVNAKTREKVLQAAKKYNYIPNSFAKSLRNAKSKSVVVMVPAVKNFFFSEVLGVISDQAFRKGYSVMIYQSNEEEEIESKNLEAIMENRVAGVIASVANAGKNKDKYLQLEKIGIPVVLFDRFFGDGPFSRIIIDNHQGAFDATGYLIRSGRKRIAFYLGGKENPVFNTRFKGYAAALEKHGISFREDLVFDGGITLEDGIRLAGHLTKEGMKTDAVLCSVDMVALGVITGSREQDVDIPGDLAVIGFDNEPAGRIIRPALTTVAQPIDDIGSSAFDLLLSKIDKKKRDQKNNIRLKMELIKRESA